MDAEIWHTMNDDPNERLRPGDRVRRVFTFKVPHYWLAPDATPASISQACALVMDERAPFGFVPDALELIAAYQRATARGVRHGDVVAVDGRAFALLPFAWARIAMSEDGVTAGLRFTHGAPRLGAHPVTGARVLENPSNGACERCSNRATRVVEFDWWRRLSVCGPCEDLYRAAGRTELD